jgi:hypothetical protein
MNGFVVIDEIPSSIPSTSCRHMIICGVVTANERNLMGQPTSLLRYYDDSRSMPSIEPSRLSGHVEHV